MTHTFTAAFLPAIEGGFVAFLEELPGAISQGATIEEARSNLIDAATLLMEAYSEESRSKHPKSGIVR